MKTAKRKSLMTHNLVCNEETPPTPPSPTAQVSLPLQFAALVAKYTLHDDTESDEGDEGDESDTNTSDNGSDSRDNDDQGYT